MSVFNNNRSVQTEGGALPNDVSIVFSNDDSGCTCSNPDAIGSNQEKGMMKRNSDSFLKVGHLSHMVVL